MADLVKLTSKDGKRTLAVNPFYVVAVRDSSGRGRVETTIRTVNGVEFAGEPIEQVLKKLDTRRRARTDAT